MRRVKRLQRLARAAQPGQAFAQRIQQIDMARRLLAGALQQRQGIVIVAGMHALQARKAQKRRMVGAGADRIFAQPHRLGAGRTAHSAASTAVKVAASIRPDLGYRWQPWLTRDGMTKARAEWFRLRNIR